MIGAGVAALILPFLISMIGGGSYYRDQEPDVLANQAEQQIAKGEHYAALDTVHLALLRSPDAAIVSAAIVLADALGFDVVAEGVETAEQLAILRRLGCRSGQGWFFGHPVEPDQISR